jgi:hypothetical protein
MLCWIDWATRPGGRWGCQNLNAEVRSPQTAVRHAVMLDSVSGALVGPKRFSTKRMSEVWSTISELAQPPLFQGETTSIGTRAPRPYGAHGCWGEPE